MTRPLHDLGARIVVLVDPMPKTHQAKAVLRVLSATDVFRNPVGRADLGQHVQGRFVRAAVSRAPKAGAARRDAGKRIGAGGTRETDCRGRRILLMVGVREKYPALAGGNTAMGVVAR